MAYFRCSSGSGNGAVLTVTYSAEFYNQTFTATNGVDTLNVFATSAGTVDIKVPSEGSWTVSCTISGDTYTSNPVVVDLSYATELVAIPKGSTVTPTDDIQTWLKCAGITDKAYTTLNEVLADTDTYTTLLGDSNACDYMARSTTWASTIVADADAMRLLGMYDYACDALLSDATWASAIAGSTYFESVLNVKVPKMTSNTAPSGECFASSSYSTSYPAYKAFDTDNSTVWASTVADAVGSSIGYDFGTSVVVSVVKIVDNNTANQRPTNVTIQGYDTEWHDIDTFSRSQQTTTNSFVNSTAYTKYRVVVNAFGGTQGTNNVNISEIQFYGRAEAQTDIIVSAPSDTIYYMDNGNPVTLCTTDTDGIGSVDWSDLPTGDITLYSSVAKNPTDLTADYSKSIKVTKNKVEGYLMPDGALYWWGYENINLEDISTANGWTRSSNWSGATAPVHNTNNIYCNAGGSTKYSGVGAKTSVTASTITAIATPSASGNNCYTMLCPSKALPNSPSVDATAYCAWSTTAGIQVITKTTTSGTANPCIITAADKSFTLQALWYE